MPAVDRTSWGETTDPGDVGHVMTNGSLRSGRAVAYVIYDSNTGLPLDPQAMPMTEGVYHLLFSAAVTSDDYVEPAPKRIDIRVIARAPYDDLSDGTGSQTLGGRVLLGNADTMAGHAIPWNDGQAYWQVRRVLNPATGRYLTQNPFWTHEGETESSAFTPYMADGADHDLHHITSDGTTNILWRLRDIRFGNNFPENCTMPNGECFLPWSPTALGFSTYLVAQKVAPSNEVCHLVMRNYTGAAIYSPCYTNGIGTIYFDAVNSQTIDVDNEAYKLVVEVATETADGLPPTDANAGENLENITDAQWQPYAMLPLKCTNGTFAALDETNELSLAVLTGGRNDNFYRVCVKVNTYGTMRFRIRRTSAVSPNECAPDYGRFILLDNILVSFPRSEARAEPYGVYHPEKRGKQALGREGAMASAAFPSLSDAGVYARAKPVTNVVAGVSADPSTFIQLTKFHYQWHYLNQASNGWQSVDLRPTANFVADAPLNLPSEVGDVSFWLETYTKIPFFDYVDYTGQGYKLGGLYTEEVGLQYYPENALEGGREFFRLRPGASEWNGIDVVLQRPGVGLPVVPMELVSDHLWRGLVRVPTNVVGDVNFYFEGGQRWEAGATTYTEAGKVWYPTAAVTNKLPARGETSIGGVPQPFRADAATGFYEFQFNDETGYFTVGHAEYQTFNSWHDAANTNAFHGTYAETSGVTVAAMVTTNAHMKTWDVLRVTDDNWNESFEMSNYEIPAYQKGVSYATHKMPHQWTGDNGMFVDASLTGTSADDRQKNAGIAWQMQGFGLGSMSFTQTDVPVGLDTITFKARLAQSPTFDDFAFCYADGMMATNNYTFLVPAILSTATKDGKANIDFSPGASMSIVGYYTPMVGCYEFRVSRDDNAGLRFSVYKWSRKGYRMTSACIGTHYFSSAAFWHANGASKPNLYGMFISLGEEEAGKVTIYAGLSSASYAPNDSYVGTEKTNPTYRAIKVVDDDKPLTAGTIGVVMSSCNGMFLTVRRHSKNMTTENFTGSASTPSDDDRTRGPKIAAYYGSMRVTSFPGTRSEEDDLSVMRTAWAYTPGRIEEHDYTGYGWQNTPAGFRPPADLNQTVNVYLKSSNAGSSASDDAAWSLFTSNTVSSYGWSTHTVTVRTNQNCHVMLKPGDAPADVTIGLAEQTAWNGADMINPPDDDFIFTQARVYETVSADKTTTNRYCALQPARAVETKPLSIRSPILEHGVGMIGFKYIDLKPGAEVWVQMSTNDLTNMAGSEGLNQSLVEGSGPGEWETVRKFKYAELAARGDEAKHYIGLHDRVGAQLRGVLRILVPTNVVASAAGVSLSNPTYGSITITDIWVQDEPAIDTTSWLGWNLRVLGDRQDTERRMYLPDPDGGDDEAGSGLSSALNNSTTEGIPPGADPSEYRLINPTIQSPTFKAGSIGSVKFKARVYDNSGVVGETARVTLYGAVDSGADDWGEALTNFVVSSPRFTDFEYRTTGRRFAAIRLAVNGVIAHDAGNPNPARVLLDEIIVSEKDDASVAFVYARPFRTHLDEDVPLAESVVLDKDEQPLIDESWGVQAKLKLDQFDGDIDVDRGFRVTLRTYKGETPWGYESWKSLDGATDEADLLQVGDAADLVFRSTAARPDSIVKPTHEPNTVVQYVLTAYYYMKGDPEEHGTPIEVGNVVGDGWTNPAWYSPIDKNAGKAEAVPYTILDGMSPGRAWINEVNYNDGTRTERGYKCVTNQFIELAVPWGVDMTGWTVWLTDINTNRVRLARFGVGGLAPVKNTGSHSGDYGFVVLESPETRQAGGIRDPLTGQAVADAQWSANTLASTFVSGQMQYSQPYQLELYRPSGILEHQFVVAGTNEWREIPELWESFGYRYEGTNLLNELNVLLPSARRFYAGEDVSVRPSNPATFASLGVTGGAHGEEGGWASDMGFTPGRLNDGQDELTGWYLRPHGGSVWVYARVEEASRGNVAQRIGEDTAQNTYALVSSGSSTNIVYDVAPWYAVEAVGVNEAGRTNYTFSGTGTGATFNLANVTETTYVVAREGIDARVIAAGLDPADRYAPAVLRWLRDGSLNGTFKNPNGPLTNAIYRGLSADSTNCVIGLKGQYWLDLDPTEPGWWLRGDFTGLGTKSRIRKFSEGSETPYSNPQIDVTLYLSNDVSLVVHAPYRLQGLNNERSDETSTYSNWTSATFKVEAMLLNGEPHNVGYLPFRWFVFGPDSFVKPEESKSVGRPPYTTRIEILDPFSFESPGYSYGWRDYKGCAVILRWNLTEQLQLSGVEMLKADSTYDGSKMFK